MRPMPGLVDCINREWCDYIGPSTTISRPFQRNGLRYISKVLPLRPGLRVSLKLAPEQVKTNEADKPPRAESGLFGRKTSPIVTGTFARAFVLSLSPCPVERSITPGSS